MSAPPRAVAFISKRFYQKGEDGYIDNNVATCTFTFTPPPQISDKHCYLTVRELAVFNSNLVMDQGETLMLASSWSQPGSVMYLDRVYAKTPIDTINYQEQNDQMNQYLALNKGFWTESDHVRTMIYMPSGPHEVTFSLRFSKGENVGEFENVSFFLEFVPLD